jgi:hypothetical protein
VPFEGLKTHAHGTLPTIHAIFEEGDIEVLSVFLKASLKHYPNDLGLLFQKDDEGQTACERAFEHEYSEKEFGKEKRGRQGISRLHCHSFSIFTLIYP